MTENKQKLDSIAKFRRATANRLRKNETGAERRLWKALRRVPLKGSHFRRQVPIGRYVADFACLAARVIIEVDGSHHGDKRAIEYDSRRTAWLESQGYTVLRFWNTDVFLNIDSVLEAVYSAVFGSTAEETRLLKHQRRRRDLSTPPRRAPRADPPHPGEGEQ